MYLDYLLAAGKEGFRERIWVHSNATLGATVGTAINADPTAFSTIEAMLVIDNTASVASTTGAANVMVIPVSIDLICTEPGTGAATFAVVRLTLDNATQYSSGGTTLSAALTFYDTRSGYADRVSFARCVFGDVALSTGNSRKIIGDYAFTSGANGFLAGDRYRFVFGSPDLISGMQTETATAAAGGVVHVTALPPIVIGRRSSLIVQPLITVLTAGPDFNVNVTCLELGHRFQTV